MITVPLSYVVAFPIMSIPPTPVLVIANLPSALRISPELATSIPFSPWFVIVTSPNWLATLPAKEIPLPVVLVSSILPCE